MKSIKYVSVAAVAALGCLLLCAFALAADTKPPAGSATATPTNKPPVGSVAPTATNKPAPAATPTATNKPVPAVTATATNKPVPPVKPPPPPNPALVGDPAFKKVEELLCHSGTYQEFGIDWRVEGKLKNVNAVFTHPFLPPRAVALAEAGAYLTDDYGATWKQLPAAAADKLGQLRWVEFSPAAADVFYLAGRRGVFATADNGANFRPVGSKAGGMAADDTLEVHLYPNDPFFRTLVAVHGDAAPGVSRSFDNGGTWSIVGKDFIIRKMLTGTYGSNWAHMAGSKKSTPDIQGVYFSYWVADYWSEVLADCIPSDATMPRHRMNGGMWSTMDKGVHFVQHDGGQVRQVAENLTGRVFSIDCMYGPTADSQIFMCYEPQVGMVISADNGFTKGIPVPAGVYKGDMVKEGAAIRGNANGTSVYCVVNGVLSHGMVKGDVDQWVADVTVTPAVLWSGPKTDVKISAKIAGKGTPPKTVTVDLSRLGGSNRTPMFDDGLHGDGAANDGTYGATFQIEPGKQQRHDEDWRSHWPGKGALTVSAVLSDGTLSGAVGILSIYNKPASFVFWDEQANQKWNIEAFPNPAKGVVGSWFDSKNAKSGKESIYIVTEGKGAWREHWGFNQSIYNVMGFDSLSFWIKCDKADDEEFYVYLQDDSWEWTKTLTPPVPLVKEKLLVGGGGVTTEWKRAVIPIGRLMKDTTNFQPFRVMCVVFGGDGKTNRTYYIDCIKFFATPEDLQADMKLP